MISPRREHARYLRPTPLIDSDNPAVVDFARDRARDRTSDVDKAVALYHAVRDEIRYDPYRIDLRPDGMRASATLSREFGFCVTKATLLAAAARATGIPSRLGFADVKNHLATERMLRLMQTDLFVYHGYTELYLRDEWIKATPAFNSSLCERFDVEPLEFDGLHDSIFQQFDRAGNRYMEYIHDHGHFAHLPLGQIRSAFEEHYPALMSDGVYSVSGTIEEDAAADQTADR